MTDVPIYDWPSAARMLTQVFTAGGAAQDGGFTVGGSAVLTPEAGGRAQLTGTLHPLVGRLNARLISWLMSKINNGNVFRFPINNSPQLVSALDLGLPNYDLSGIPWDNGQPWDTGFNWMFEPGCLIAGSASEGSTTVTVDLTPIGSALGYGHLIGLGGRAYIIDDIDTTVETAAVLTLNPPLRTDVAAGDFLTLRPTMLATVKDPTTLRNPFDGSGITQPGSITLLEALP